MKFTLAALRKLNMPYEFEEEMDLTNDLVGTEDILKVGKVSVAGIIKELADELYEINFKVEASLILECATSLKEVPYQISTSFTERFTTDDKYEDAFIIDGQTLDTKEAVITNILIAKPVKVYAEGEEFISDSEPEKQDEHVNEAFKSLKDLL